MSYHNHPIQLEFLPPTDTGDLITLRSLVVSLQERSKFELDLANKSFLDSSWDRPEVRRFELVPCKDLGLMICPVRGYVVVTKVKSYSVAGEDSKVSLAVLVMGFVLMSAGSACVTSSAMFSRALKVI